MNIEISNSFIQFFPKVLLCLLSRGMVTKGFLSLVFMLGIFISAIAQQTPPELPVRKRFIDKVEVFAGPNLSFNYGNKFIENYKDQNFENKQLISIGYTLGVGLYHPIRDRFDINVRLSLDQKGSNTELNTPTLMINSQYLYRYLTVSLLPKFYFDSNKKFHLIMGGYYSALKSVKGSNEVYEKNSRITFYENFEGRSVRGFRDDGSVHTISFSPGTRSFEKVDYGLIMGIGHSIDINSQGKIVIQFMDNYGLSNINKPSVGILDNPPEKNHTILLLISYVLHRPLKNINN